ncbi:MAG: hypothetical protein ACI87E_002042 [Mariniblastus sp.]
MGITFSSSCRRSQLAKQKHRLTIFAVPKPFTGHTAVIQRNAIKSWCQLAPEVEVLLIGGDLGVAEMAAELSIRHFPDVSKNEYGTPLLDSVFRIAHAQCQSPTLMYINSDVLLTRSILDFLAALEKISLPEFLAIGMRQDFEQESLIDFEGDWESITQTHVARTGQYASMLCKDYFIFPASKYQKIPAFSIGRGNWDSWMVSTSVQAKIPVIDATASVFAGHQNHGYGHVGGRMQAYLAGSEAKANIKLAGGRRYISGSVPTHRISSQGTLKRINRLRLIPFVWDLPRVAKQLFSFLKPD